MEKEIDCRATEEVTCPYCGYEYSDSWEFGDDTDRLKCPECNKEFDVSSETTRTFSTSKIDCIEKGEEHDFKFKDSFMKTTKFEKVDGDYKDVPLAETEWTYDEIFACENCDETEYRQISKEDFITKYPEEYQRWKEYHIKRFLKWE